MYTIGKMIFHIQDWVHVFIDIQENYYTNSA